MSIKDTCYQNLPVPRPAATEEKIVVFHVPHYHRLFHLVCDQFPFATCPVSAASELIGAFESPSRLASRT